MAKQKPPVIVAELGRPETRAETAARKANDSRLYRSRKTVNNLVFSLIVSVGVMVLIALMATGLIGGKNVFGEQDLNVQQLAQESAGGAGRQLAAPATPEGWKAKQALLGTSGGVIYWRVDYTTSSHAYVAVVQAFTADGSPVSEKWISTQLEQQKPTGSETLGGISWVVYDHPDRDPDSSNLRFGLSADVPSADLTGSGQDAINNLLVYGTDDPGVIRAFATQVADSLSSTTTPTAEESQS